MRIHRAAFAAAIVGACLIGIVIGRFALGPTPVQQGRVQSYSYSHRGESGHFNATGRSSCYGYVYPTHLVVVHDSGEKTSIPMDRVTKIEFQN